MSYAAPAYLDQLQALLPQGAAWPREAGANLTRLLDAFAQELGRVDARLDALVDETDPRTAIELLDNWEDVLGLPDPCTAAATSVAGRQAAAWRKLAFQAGQTPAFYVALAASIGFAIQIFEFDPNVDDYDSSLTPLITNGRYRYVWRVHVLSGTDYAVARVGDSVGVRLVEGGSISLECVIRAAKPAHTRVVFTYQES